MQCMMKEVCGQCLQAHRDPLTGRQTFVFTCAGQDQPMDLVDFAHLSARLRQQGVLEKLANLWLDHLLAGAPLTWPGDRREGLATSGGLVRGPEQPLRAPAGPPPR